MGKTCVFLQKIQKPYEPTTVKRLSTNSDYTHGQLLLARFSSFTVRSVG